MTERLSPDSTEKLAWLTNVSYEPGRVTLTLIRADDQQSFQWSDPSFRPYYLTDKEPAVEPVKKLDLFTRQERTLEKVTYLKTPPRSITAWGLLRTF